MKKFQFLFFVSALVACLISQARASGVFFADNVGNAMNGKVVLVSTAAVAVSLTSPLNHTLVVKNDDMENAIFYGGSDCSLQLGQKIDPMEKVTFQGVNAGFTIYVCTASGSAELRLVEHS